VSFSQSGSVGVFDGLNGTGNQLAFISLCPNAGPCPGCSGQFCPFSPVGVAFAGVAKSVSFAGVANQIVFDDITFVLCAARNSGPVAPPGTTSATLVAVRGY
jgi:hypothetical protein